MLQRLSPFLNSNKPCDIIDFNPGVGLLSSKINQLLQPRRHVLVESRPSRYRSFLADLASKPSFKLVPHKVERLKRIDWTALLKQHFQDLVPIKKSSGRNDNLLVILNLADSKMDMAYFSISRHWLATLEDALNGTGVHNYGMARILLISSPEEAELLIPRRVNDRKKVALMSEALSRHLIVVAETDSNESMNALREWQVMVKSAARTAQRTVEANIATPAERERPPVPAAPDYLQNGPHEHGAYALRARLENDQRYLDVKEALERRKVHTGQTADDQTGIDNLKAEFQKLENEGRRYDRKTYERLQLVDKWLDIMSVETEFVRVMSETPTNSQRLREINARLAAMKADFSRWILERPEYITRAMNIILDDRQAALGAEDNLDRAALVWDRRPFEPLYVKKSEVWPPGSGCSILYFEPELQSQIVQNLRDENGKPRSDEIALHSIVIAALGQNGIDSLDTLLEKMFPGRPAVDIIKAVPSLFPYVLKQLASSSDESVWSSETTSIYDKFEYDLTHLRLRVLPISVMLDLIAEYSRWPNRPPSLLQVNRDLGGSMSAFNSGSSAFEFTTGKSAGKVKNL